MLGTGVAITTKPADVAVSYAKYTVSPKVRGNWKLKSVKHPNPEHPTPWVVYKKMKIDTYSITLNRLTTKITGMNPVSRKMYSRLALSRKYYFYTMIGEAASNKEVKQIQAYTKKYRYLNAGQDLDGYVSKSLQKNGLGFMLFYPDFAEAAFGGKMVRKGNQLIFKQGTGTVTRYVKE